MRPPRLPPTRFRWREWRDEEAVFLQLRFAPSAIFSLANHSWISRETGVAWTSLASARSNDCCAAKSSVRFARDTAVRIRRSGAFTVAMGAHSASARRRATSASFLRRHRHGCIQPGLKFATTGRDRARQVVQFQTQYRHHFRGS